MTGKRTPGRFKGQIHIADDFDQTPASLKGKDVHCTLLDSYVLLWWADEISEPHSISAFKAANSLCSIEGDSSSTSTDLRILYADGREEFYEVEFRTRNESTIQLFGQCKAN